MDCWNWCYSYWMGGICRDLVMEQAGTSEVDDQREEGPISASRRKEWRKYLGYGWEGNFVSV